MARSGQGVSDGGTAREKNVERSAKGREVHPATAQDAAGLMPLESEGVQYEAFAN